MPAGLVLSDGSQAAAGHPRIAIGAQDITFPQPMRFVGWRLQHGGIGMGCGAARGLVRVGFVKAEFRARAPRARFGQQRQTRVGALGRIGVKLKGLAMIGHDREILRQAMRRSMVSIS